MLLRKKTLTFETSRSCLKIQSQIFITTVKDISTLEKRKKILFFKLHFCNNNNMTKHFENKM